MLDAINRFDSTKHYSEEVRSLLILFCDLNEFILIISGLLKNVYLLLLHKLKYLIQLETMKQGIFSAGCAA